MKRKCLIHATFPITCFTVPIIGDTELNLTTEEIYQCLCAKAEVVEVLPNGKKNQLDFSNYDKTEVKETKVDKKSEEIKIKEVLPVKEVVEENTTIKEEKEEVVTLEDKVEQQDKIVEDNPVRTHQVSSRNNYNGKNKKNRNKR